MRKKDWADQTAESLQDVISEGDDQQLIEVIAVELRKAFFTGLLMEKAGNRILTTGNYQSTHILSYWREPANPDVLKALDLIAKDERLPHDRETWDGVPGMKVKKAPA